MNARQIWGLVLMGTGAGMLLLAILCAVHLLWPPLLWAALSVSSILLLGFGALLFREGVLNEGAKQIAQRWEELRIVYNIVLLGEGLWALREHLAPAFARFWFVMLLFALAANALYCLGPLLEISVDALLVRRIKRSRYLIFLVGLRGLVFLAGLLFAMWYVWTWSPFVVDYFSHPEEAV